MDMELTERAKKNGEAGFSMVEALIAAGILLIIAMGLIPLFSRSIVNNALGNDYTQATAHAKTDLETLHHDPISNVDLTVAAGTSLQRIKYVEKGIQQGTPVSSQDWKFTPTSTDKVLWTRTTRVRQFGVNAFDDGVLSDIEALPAGTDPSFVQIKEVTTYLDSGKMETGKPGPFAAIRQTSFQVMKPF